MTPVAVRPASRPRSAESARKDLCSAGWSSDMFGSRAKAIGFTALLEGIMMTADAGWLSAIALGYLVAINATNAVANGCRLALRDNHSTTEVVDWPANLARGLAAVATATAAAATATRVRKPEQAARSRRARSCKTIGKVAAASAYGSN